MPDHARWLRKRSPIVSALLAGGGYALAATLWATYADGILDLLAVAHSQRVSGAGIKGSVFIVLSAIALGFVVLRAKQWRNVTERVLQNQGADSTTGLANRLTLETTLDRVCRDNRDGQQVFGILLLDIVNLERINVALGRSAGDELLRALGARLHDNIRVGDLAARLEGDLFVVLLKPPTREGEANLEATRLLRHLREPLRLGDMEPSVDFHAAIALAPQDGRLPASLLDTAIRAIRRAKDYTTINHPMRIRGHGWSDGTLTEETALRDAIRNGSLQAWLQPQVELEHFSVIGAEALLRWPSRPEANIETCIRIAERHGLIKDITRLMLEQTVAAAARWHAAGLPALTYGVNLSSIDLRTMAVVNDVRTLLRDTGLPPRYLALEITESQLMEDPENTLEILTDLHAVGVKIAMDDFGTGYSSLSYLNRFPVDVLKIDRSFVRGAARDSRRRALLATICQLGESIGVRTVAEGVEAPMDAQLARDLRCSSLQGYLAAPGLPPKTFHDRYLAIATGSRTLHDLAERVRRAQLPVV